MSFSSTPNSLRLGQCLAYKKGVPERLLEKVLAGEAFADGILCRPPHNSGLSTQLILNRVAMGYLWRSLNLKGASAKRLAAPCGSLFRKSDRRGCFYWSTSIAGAEELIGMVQSMPIHSKDDDTN